MFLQPKVAQKVAQKISAHQTGHLSYASESRRKLWFSQSGVLFDVVNDITLCKWQHTPDASFGKGFRLISEVGCWRNAFALNVSALGTGSTTINNVNECLLLSKWKLCSTGKFGILCGVCQLTTVLSCSFELLLPL